MAVLTDKIVMVLTGGTGNKDPRNSLGGDPSNFHIQNTINNLFTNVSEEQAEEGMTDYRCVYVFNDGSQTLYGISAFVASEVEGGSNVFIGMSHSDCVHRLNFAPIPTERPNCFLWIATPGKTMQKVMYSSDLKKFAADIREAIMAGTDLVSVSVTGYGGANSLVFDIAYYGQDGNRYHELPIIDDSNLYNDSTYPPVKSNVTAYVVSAGGPINSIPPEIAIETEEPPNVFFDTYTKYKPLLVGTLRSGEGFPLWLKRITDPDTARLVGDGVAIQVKGSPIPGYMGSPEILTAVEG